jgi:ubiquinone/menaquinone biosynthesis C-methylase UbiE
MASEMRVANAGRPVPKNWWRGFFDSVMGELLFPSSKIAQSASEVDHVIKQTKAKPPLDVLDLACGIGRHSVCFAVRGFRVTGLDYSRPFLLQARKNAHAQAQPITFVRGDMRNLKPHFAANTFDLAVCLYTSFGYFARRADDRKVLRAVYRVLRPGGAFVVNTVNRAAAVKRLRSPVSLGSEPLPNVFMIDSARYDPRRRQTVTTWTIIDARRSRTRIARKSFRVNVYTHSELKALLRAAGFRVETVWGLLPGGRFDRNKTWHQTIVARKPSSRYRKQKRRVS